ncbi:MAG: heavy metal translocating P-type ATPase [Butyrivibrio sp.]|nr:heavy metal translocating P-type ATPase [Butyrivibrio sp.]
MTKYTVTGMSCAACQARVEKAVSQVPGVTECAVSLLTNSMGVSGSASEADIIRAVENAGYGASVQTGNAASPENPAASGPRRADGASVMAAQEEALRDHETPVLKKRLIISVVFLLVLMYFSMGHHMWGWPLPAFFEGNMLANGIVQMLLSGIVMVINQRFFISGFRSVLHGAPNMDTLVALGSGVSFLYSVAALLLMSRAVADGDAERAHALMNEFYFESAAMIVTLITIGKMLEAMSKGRTTDALKSLMKLAPKTAVLLRDGEEVTVPVETVVSGDVFVIRPGENIPVDGVVLEGESAVNESALTGESVPVDKAEGDPVSAGTINTSGFLKCQATRVGVDTTLSQIIQMVSDAAATKAPIAKIADRVSAVFVPAVIAVAVITFAVWMYAGEATGFALARAIAVLVISCPCALGLATPVAIMVGNGIGAKNGILFKTSASLEQAGRVKVVALDKTGTITQGEPRVTDIVPAEQVSEEALLEAACALEAYSEHPLAKAVNDYREAHNIIAHTLTDFQALPGNGLSGELDGYMLRGGNEAFIRNVITDTEVFDALVRKASALAQEGKTPLYFARNSMPLGVIAVADVIREDSAEAIRQMRNMGVRVVMLTGDNERTAQAIGKAAGVDEVVAGVLPDGKERVIRELSEAYGATGMIGDGINDAPALTRADTGIAIGAGTDVALDAADVVLMKSSLMDAAAAIRLSRATLTNIHQNLFWAFFYNVIGIPLAAGAYIRAFGWTLNPMFGAAAMSLSSFCVCMNALRLNLRDIYDTGHDRPQGKQKQPVRNAPAQEMADCGSQGTDGIMTVSVKSKEAGEMATKTMTIEGMMCAHCEATVKKALEALDGVESADVSHEKGEAVVHLSGDVADDVLKKTVEDKEYAVKQIA